MIHISWIGVIYLTLLFVPNILWTKYQPIGYDHSHENKILLLCERMGEILVSIFVVISFQSIVVRFDFFMILSMICMVFYESYWIRYFLSQHTLRDFYRPFLMIPVPGATFPIAGLLFLGLSQHHFCLIISTLILAIGHIGIHLQHFYEL